MPAPLNRHQPQRPFVNPENNSRLMYRLYPILGDEGLRSGKVYRTSEPANQLVQLQLYRWSRSDDFVDIPASGDLYEHLILRPFRGSEKIQYLPSSNHFGRTILNALNYDPRKLKGVTKDNPKARQTYVFGSPLELQYGLEYMICAWLRKFLNESSAPGAAPVSGPEMMAEELDILADTPWDDYLGLYVEPLQNVNRRSIEEPNWRDLKRKASSDIEVDEDGIPVMRDSVLSDSNPPQEPKGKLQSFNRRA